MARYRIVPDVSQVWIEGRSSVHPIHSSTTGLEGWIDLRMTESGHPDLRTAPSARIEFAVSHLRSSNPIEDRELRRRIDARAHPTIEGTLTSIERADESGRFVVSGDVTFRGVTRPHVDLMDIELLADDSLHLGGRCLRPGGRHCIAHAAPSSLSIGAAERPSSRSRMIV